MDQIFKALADPTRRFLLDLLFQRDGRTLKDLESELAMTRFGVMKHLKVLEDAGLVITGRSGQEKLQFLNAVPIRMIHDPWIDKHRERKISALLALKAELEGQGQMTMTDKAATVLVYRIVIKASAHSIWDAITKPEWTERYAYGGRVQYELKGGGHYHHEASPEMKSFGLPDKVILGEVLESDPPRKLVQTWHPQFTPEMTAEPPSRLTYEIMEGQGVCTVTITHDVTGAPMVAGMVPGGGDPAKGGGGWPWVLSDLKSLLETGARMPT